MHKVTRPPDRPAPLAGAPAQQGWPAPGPQLAMPAAPVAMPPRPRMLLAPGLPGRVRLPACAAVPPERSGAPWGNEPLGQFMEKKGFRLAPDHPGLTWKQTMEVRDAMSVLFRNPRREPALVIHDACVQGYRPYFDALLCLIRNGLLDPNAPGTGRMKGETLLHSIAIEGTDDFDYAPGHATASERIGGLVQAGTDIHARDGTLKLTALEYARLRRQDVIAEALTYHGAVTDFDSEDDISPVHWT